MNTLNTTSFTAFIGIDWADAKHDICVQSAEGEADSQNFKSNSPQMNADEHR